MTGKDFPYTALDQKCAYDPAKITPVRPSGHNMVKANSYVALKTAM